MPTFGTSILFQFKRQRTTLHDLKSADSRSFTAWKTYTFKGLTAGKHLPFRERPRWRGPLAEWHCGVQNIWLYCQCYHVLKILPDHHCPQSIFAKLFVTAVALEIKSSWKISVYYILFCILTLLHIVFAINQWAQTSSIIGFYFHLSNIL